MKRLIVGAAITLVSTASFAQKKITEGVITYKVEWMPPPAAQQMAAMFPRELQVHFRADSSAVDTKTNFFSNRVIMNSKTEYLRLLVDMSMANKKYSVLFTPDDMEQMQERSPEFETTPTTETKTINGYQATKYKVKDKKSGQTFEAWFTKDIEVTENPLTAFYDKNLGVPLDFRTVASGMPVKATVAAITESKVPAGTFGGAKEYQEITFAELMGMMGGGRR